MIKFFRKIRRNLLNEGKTTRYFKYAIGEILLVVIGILIALQINNWNENNKRDVIRQSYYKQLLEDLDKDKIYIENRIIQFDSLIANYNTYLETYKEPNLSIEQVFININKLGLKSVIMLFNTSTLESLQSTGDIKLIPPTIRNKLIDLKRGQDLMLKSAEGNDKGKNEILQNATMEIGSGSLIESLGNQQILREFLNLESKYPNLILLMEAAIYWKNLSETRILTPLKKILKDNETLAELITNELKK